MAERTDQPAQQDSPAPAPATPAPVTLHWIMTVQTATGRQGTNDGRIEAIPGIHTREGTFAAVRKSMEQWIGTTEFTVLFFALAPQAISAPAGAA